MNNEYAIVVDKYKYDNSENLSGKYYVGSVLNFLEKIDYSKPQFKNFIDYRKKDKYWGEKERHAFLSIDKLNKKIPGFYDNSQIKQEDLLSFYTLDYEEGPFSFNIPYYIFYCENIPQSLFTVQIEKESSRDLYPQDAFYTLNYYLKFDSLCGPNIVRRIKVSRRFLWDKSLELHIINSEAINYAKAYIEELKEAISTKHYDDDDGPTHIITE